jgi:hypothetical protein
MVFIGILKCFFFQEAILLLIDNLFFIHAIFIVIILTFLIPICTFSAIFLGNMLMIFNIRELSKKFIVPIEKQRVKRRIIH